MKKITLLDAFSTIHVGNGALLENTINICKMAYGQDCEIKIITRDVVTNNTRYNNVYESVFYLDPKNNSKFKKLLFFIKIYSFLLLHVLNELTFKITSSKLTFTKNQKETLQCIEESDICISLSGENLNDILYMILPTRLLLYWLAIKKGKKVIFFPQSVGPFRKGWLKKLVYVTLKDAAIFAGRDQKSFETLHALGFDPKKIVFMPDIAIQQEVGNADINKYFENNSKKVIGITISNPPVKELGKKVDFVESVGSEIEKLDAKAYKILIMPSNYVRGAISSDYALCLKLKEKLSNKFETVILENRPYFPDEYTALLSQLEFFVSTRMHVAILATSAFTPTIAINTQHKIMGYMKNIAMEHFCVEYENLDTIYELSQEIESTREQVVENLKIANAKLKKEHEVLVARLKEIAK